MASRAAAFWLVTVLAFAGAAPPAHGEDYFDRDEYSFEVTPPRSRGEKITIAALFGGAAAVAGVSTLFLRDAAAKADAISYRRGHSGRIYTPELDETRAAADRSSAIATVGYSLAGVLAVAGVAAIVITEPEKETLRVGSRAQSFVAPLPGGALAGRAWTF